MGSNELYFSAYLNIIHHHLFVFACTCVCVEHLKRCKTSFGSLMVDFRGF